MPLSKAQDKARKRIVRAQKIVQPNSNLNPVQPNKAKSCLVQPKYESPKPKWLGY